MPTTIPLHSDDEVTSLIWAAYRKLGEWSLRYVRDSKKGKKATSQFKSRKNKIVVLYTYLALLIIPDEDGNLEGEVHPDLLDENKREDTYKILNALIKLTGIYEYPIVPIITAARKPVLYQVLSPKGDKGDQGDAGSNAGIIVQLKAGELQLEMTSNTVSGVTTYELSLVEYTEPQISFTIPNSVYEIGDVLATFNISITTTKGKDDITALTALADATLDAALQALITPIVPGAGLNAVGQPVITALVDTNVSTNKTYNIQIDDGTSQNSQSKSVSFVYPILSGPSGSILTNGTGLYTLTKLIQVKATTTVQFTGTDTYFYFGYDASYGTLTKIEDQNGFDVTSEFTSALLDVDSIGLDNNWTVVSFRTYRTTNKTTINTKNYKFYF